MFLNEIFKVDSSKKAVKFLLLAAVLWSTGGLFIKSVQWNPLAIVSVRGLIAVLTIMFIVPECRVLPQNKMFWLGCFAYAGLCTTMVVGTKLTTAANAIFLQYTAPIYVALISAFILKEKIGKLDLLVIFSTAAGMALFFVGEFSFDSIVGNLFGIGSGLCFALMVICFRYIKGIEPSAVVFYGNLFCFFIGFPYIEGPYPDVNGWVCLAFLGIAQIGLPYIIYSRAVVHVRPLEAVIIPTIEPVLNPIWVAIFIGEVPTPWAIMGGLIVISVVTFYCIKKAQRV